MPAMAALTLADGQGTPANHTFAVSTTTGRKATWFEKSAGAPAGYYRLDHEVREASSSTGAHRVFVNLTLPTMATVNGVSTKVRSSSAQLVFNFAQDSTDQERKDLVSYYKNLLANATMYGALWSIEPQY